MNYIDRPNRLSLTADIAQLTDLEGEIGESITELSPTDLLVMESLFQPRETGLLMRRGASVRHVDEMAQVVKGGRFLDPIAVAAFGSCWVLIDGHHRLEAYRQAGVTGPVPVRVHESPTKGRERVLWAMGVSSSLNVKDKLPMTQEDKFDNAWRLVVSIGYGRSKDDLVGMTGVADGTIATMRRVRKALEEAGISTDTLYAMLWPIARWEYRKLHGDDDSPIPDFDEKRLRQLIKRLTPALRDRVPASLLLEALESLRPGIGIDLDDAIKCRAAYQRALAELDI